jgi:hypothetical protein
MAVVPTGSPAWTRAVDFSHYGGSSDKQNYLGRGAIDALTDVDAEEYSRAMADQAAAVRTADFAVMVIQCSDTSPAAPTVTFCALMTGVRLTSYVGSSPPAGFPAVARNGNGDFTITFASSYSDEYSVAGAYAPTKAHATAATAGAFATATVSGQTVQVVVTTDAGAAVSDPLVNVTVY